MPSRDRVTEMIDRVKAPADKRPLDSVPVFELTGIRADAAPKSKYDGPAFGPNSVVAKKWRAK